LHISPLGSGPSMFIDRVYVDYRCTYYELHINLGSEWWKRIEILSIGPTLIDSPVETRQPECGWKVYRRFTNILV
jgi:hypothetical protein